MSDIIRKQIAEARELRAKATQGEWVIEPKDMPHALDDEVRDDKGDKIAECGMGSFTDWQARDNARFIFEAANNWGRLLRQLEIACEALDVYAALENLAALGCRPQIEAGTVVANKALKEMESV